MARRAGRAAGQLRGDACLPAAPGRQRGVLTPKPTPKPKTQDAEGQINCVAVHPSRPHLATSGVPIPTPNPEPETQDAERQIKCVAVHPSRPFLAASGNP